MLTYPVRRVLVIAAFAAVAAIGARGITHAQQAPSVKRTVLLQHDVVTLRPYTRINHVAGTKGVFRDYPARLFLDGQKRHDRWGKLNDHKKRFEHPLWQRRGARLSWARPTPSTRAPPGWRDTPRPKLRISIS